MHVVCEYCLIRGSEMWVKNVEHEVNLDRAEMSMIRWICWKEESVGVGTSYSDDERG